MLGGASTQADDDETAPAASVAADRVVRKLRFSDCDPAGIAFFPQILSMLNGAIEEWFDDILGVNYAALIGKRRLGLPTARLEVDFTAVSRHGDTLVVDFRVERLGRSSLALRTTFRCGDELRVRVRQVLVCTSLEDHRPRALPDDLRAALSRRVAAAPP